MFKLGPDIIKTNILSKFHEVWVKIVAARVWIIFYYDLTNRPTFLPFPTHVYLDTDIINILSKFEEDWVKTVAARVLTKFY